MKLRTVIIISAMSLTAFILVNLASFRLPNPVPAGADAGKKVWQAYNCVECHTLFGNGGYVGDDLTHVIKKMNPEELRDYLVNPPVMRPNRKKHHPGVTQAEARDLVSYFKYVNTIPTLGWPPKPSRPGGNP